MLSKAIQAIFPSLRRTLRPVERMPLILDGLILCKMELGMDIIVYQTITFLLPPPEF